MVGKEYTAGSLWARPHTVGPGSLFILLWGSSVVQRELGPLRIHLELSFLVGRDRPSCVKLPGNKPSWVAPQHLCVLSMRLVSAWLVHPELKQLSLRSISNLQAHNRLLLCSRRFLRLHEGTRNQNQIGSKTWGGESEKNICPVDGFRESLNSGCREKSHLPFFQPGIS